MSARGDAHVISGFEGSQMLVVPAEESEMIEIRGKNDPARRVGRFSQRRLMPPVGKGARADRPRPRSPVARASRLRRQIELEVKLLQPVGIDG